MSEFLRTQQDLEEARRPRVKHPTGWEPGVDTAAGSVTYVSDVSDTPSDWSDIIRQFGLPTDLWTVDTNYPVQVRTWDTPGGVRLYYYKATIQPATEVTHQDLDELIKRVRASKKKRPPAEGRPERAMVVCLADWQAGKRDGGGIEALSERLEELRLAVPARVRQLKKAGITVDSLYIVSLGDLVEGCGEHYPMQTWLVEIDGRQQEKFVRRMLVDLIEFWSPLAPHVVVTCVPGNHGERRKDGKAFTSFEDNVDLAVVEQAGEILARNPDSFGHVRFHIPDGDMTVTLDVCGTVCSFAHGHQARKGATPQGRLSSWWKDKGAARHPVGDADILVTGHYHHLQVVQDGPRTWMQAPANDGGSRWFEEMGGSTTVCGTLTFTVDQDGWDNLKVLR